MSSLTDLISSLPLDAISDALSSVTIWWSHLVANVPSDRLPLYAYVGFSTIALILWLFVAHILPKPIGSMTWIAGFAILFTPNMAINETNMISGELAPASIAAVYGILMKDTGLVLRSIVPIMLVFCAGLFLGFIWQSIRKITESNDEKEQRRAIKDKQANLQLATANYIDLVEDDGTQGELVKVKKDT